MKALFRTLLVFSLTLTVPIVSLAGIYKYRDANGRLNFVDDESRIPAEFREDKISISEAQEPLTVYESQENLEEPAETPSLEIEEPDRSDTEETLREHQTPVEITGNRVLVPVEVAIEGRTAKLSLLLDTGATRTVFHRQSLSKLDLPEGKTFKAQIAGGGSLLSERIKFRRIEIGPFRIKNASAMVIDFKGRDQGIDGMLGMDFLKTHPYRIDFQESVITWDPID